MSWTTSGNPPAEFRCQKTFGADEVPPRVEISIQGVETSILMHEFLLAVIYVLTNNDLVPGDPRRDFVESVRTMHEVQGFAENGKKLEPPFFSRLFCGRNESSSTNGGVRKEELLHSLQPLPEIPSENTIRYSVPARHAPRAFSLFEAIRIASH